MGDKLTYSVILLSSLFLFLACFIIVFLLLYKRKQNQARKDRELLKSQFSQTLLQSQLEIQEQTLQKISEEIHDNIGQVLSLTKLNLGTMNLQEPEQLQQKIDDSKTLVAKAIQDLRDLSKSLNTHYISQTGLRRALEYELELLHKAAGLDANLHTEGVSYQLDKQKELILFRIAQEAINNIIKHANATQVTVLLQYHPSLFMLTITDNGQGFDFRLHENDTIPTFGLGITNMRQRAAIIGAEYNLSSTPGKGTTVQILLPVTPNQSENDNQ